MSTHQIEALIRQQYGELVGVFSKLTEALRDFRQQLSAVQHRVDALQASASSAAPAGGISRTELQDELRSLKETLTRELSQLRTASTVVPPRGISRAELREELQEIATALARDLPQSTATIPLLPDKHLTRLELRDELASLAKTLQATAPPQPAPISRDELRKELQEIARVVSSVQVPNAAALSRSELREELQDVYQRLLHEAPVNLTTTDDTASTAARAPEIIGLIDGKLAELKEEMRSYLELRQPHAVAVDSSDQHSEELRSVAGRLAEIEASIAKLTAGFTTAIEQVQQIGRSSTLPEEKPTTATKPRDGTAEPVLQPTIAPPAPESDVRTSPTRAQRPPVATAPPPRMAAPRPAAEPSDPLARLLSEAE